jgi:UDP:flavonoid glycosyltransferase YjiC (YdhE family)
VNGQDNDADPAGKLLMRVLFTSIRATGHFTPLLPFASALQGRGHEVRVASPPDMPHAMAQAVAAAGLVHTPVGHPGDAALQAAFAREKDLPAERQVGYVVREIFADLLPRAALPALSQTIRDWRPDLIVREAAELAAVIAAAEAGIPHVRVSVSNGHRFQHSIAPVDALRAEAGLAPDNGASLRAACAFTAFPASMEEPGGDGGDLPQFRVRLPRDAALEGRPEWAVASVAPRVYITFGTVLGASAKSRATFRAALDAVASMPLTAMMTTGPSMDRDALGPIPANVTLRDWVPQDHVLPHVDAVFCHAGSGTVIGGLAAGLPFLAAPVGADQPDNARRLAAIGAGLAVDAPDAAAMAVALRRVLEEPSFRDRSRGVAAEIAALPDVDAAVDAMLALA